MRDLTFLGMYGADLAALAVDLRALAVFESSSGPVLIAAGGRNGGVFSVSLKTGKVLDKVAYTSSMVSMNTGTLTLLPSSGGTIAVVGTNATGKLVGYWIEEAGTIGASVTLSVTASATVSVSALSVTESGDVLAKLATGAYATLTETTTASLSQIATISDVLSSGLTTVLDTIRLGTTDFLLTLRPDVAGISSYKIASGGAATAVDSYGASDGLGLLSTAIGLEAVTIAGKTFVIAGTASAGSGALTVMQLGTSCALSLTDHVLDSLSTRFGAMTAMDVVTVGDRAFVVAGGGDGGVTVFLLLPTGRLLHLVTMEDTADMGLEAISALTVTQVGETLRILVASQSTAGVTQLSLSLADMGNVVMAAGGKAAGGAKDDVLVGSSSADVLTGGAGDDILVDGKGADTLTGGAGADLFVLEADGAVDVITDFVYGTDRLDLSAVPMLYSASQLVVTSTSTGAILTFASGEQTRINSANGKSLTANQILDSIEWATDRPPLFFVNEIDGTTGNDRLFGDSGTDSIRGNSGNDWLDGREGDDTIYGGSGNDTILGQAGDDVLYGEAGNDTIKGHDGNDWLDGGDGNDTLVGGNGDDTLLGQDGRDRLYGQAGNDYLKGHAGNDWLDGGNGNDTLDGGEGNDTLLGQSGNDYLIGWVGNDYLKGHAGMDTLDGGEGNDWLDGGANSDVIYGGAGDDTLLGQHGNDSLYAGAGEDFLKGHSGNDWLDGGSGNDTLYGGTGNDTLLGQAGNDRLFGEIGNDYLKGHAGADWLDGGDGNDTLLGGSGNDTLLGQNGDDLIYGESGNDYLKGHAGNDWLDGGTGNDTLEGGVGNDTLLGQAGDDILYGWTGDDFLKGHDGRDMLDAGDGNDWLDGGNGADTLIGGLGNDTLTGGAGADVFVFVGETGSDIIRDFAPAEDVLRLSIGVTSMAQIDHSQASDGLLLSWTGGDVLLIGLQWSDLSASNFDLG